MYQFEISGNAKVSGAAFMKKLGPEKAASVAKIVHRGKKVFVFLDREEYREWAEKNPAPKERPQG